MTAKRFLLAAALAFVALPAEAGHRPRPRARPHVYVHAPAARIYVGPWAATYAPAARAGWVWVAGYYHGARWFPGYWRPAAARVGWLWVAGYWADSTYVDGYWREENRGGQAWVDGYYDDDNNWVPGYWAPNGSADAAHERSVESGERPAENEGVMVPDGPPPEPPATSGAVYHEYE